MKIGPILITTESERNKETANLGKYVAEEMDKIQQKWIKENKISQKDAELNKSLSYVGYSSFLDLFSGKKTVKDKTDIETLTFWASELPQCPQTIAYIINTCFARDWTIDKKGGEKETAEDKQKRNRIQNFFKKCNANKQTFEDLIKAVFRDSATTGDGYIEKIMNRGVGTKKELKYLTEAYRINPKNMLIMEDEKESKRGVTRLTGYAKLENSQVGKRKKINIKDLPNDSKLKIWEVAHLKYDDMGDLYGHTPLEYNQQLTKFILNVLNLNQKKFTNEIRHSLHVDLGKGANQADADMFLSQYNAKYLGKHNFGKPLVTFGDIEVKTWDLPTKEFDFQTFMEKFGMQHAPGLFNVSPSELNNTDAKYANAEQGHITTILNTIYPWQEKIEKYINIEFIPYLEGLTKEQFDTPEEVETVFKFSLGRELLFTMYENLKDIVSAVRSAVMSPEEARKIVDIKNLPVIEGAVGDWSREYYAVLGSEIYIPSKEYFGGTDNEDEKVLGTDDEGMRRIEDVYDRITRQKRKKV